MKSSRRRSREFALQGLYQWLVAGGEVSAIVAHLSEVKGFDKIDNEHFLSMLNGVIRNEADLDKQLQPHLDRPLGELSPIERAIMLLAAFELTSHPEIPYKVVINEAVELAKSYGGTDGHKYVNGVIDKLAIEIRAVEVVK